MTYWSDHRILFDRRIEDLDPGEIESSERGILRWTDIFDGSERVFARCRLQDCKPVLQLGAMVNYVGEGVIEFVIVRRGEDGYFVYLLKALQSCLIRRAIGREARQLAALIIDYPYGRAIRSVSGQHCQWPKRRSTNSNGVNPN